MGRIWTSGGGGGADLDVVTAGAWNVEAGKVIVGPDGEPLTGTLRNITSDSTIDHASNNTTPVVLGDQAFVSQNSDGVTRAEIRFNGTRGVLEPNTLIAIPQSNMASAGGLTAEKLLAGQSAFGISGTASSGQTASASRIWAGYTATVNGQTVTGNLPTQGGSTTTPGTVAKTIVTPNKIVTGSIIVAGDANLVPGNIKKNVSIFGVKGTFEGYVADTTDLFDNGNNAAGFSLNRDGQITGGAIYYPKKYNNYVFAILTGSKSYPFANYNSLNIDFYITDQSGSSKENLIQLYNGSTTVAAYNYTSGYYPAGRRTVTINISAVGGSFVPVIRIDSSFTWSGAMYIYKIWLS